MGLWPVTTLVGRLGHGVWSPSSSHSSLLAIKYSSTILSRPDSSYKILTPCTSVPLCQQPALLLARGYLSVVRVL